jgi:hypothetical protein
MAESPSARQANDLSGGMAWRRRLATSQLPESRGQKADETECDQGSKRRNPVHGRGCGPFRSPVQPPDDTALAIEQGLHLAIAVGRNIVESQPPEPGSLLQDPDEPRVIAGQVRSDRLQGLDCPSQSLAMPGFGTIISLPRHFETEAEADDRRSDQDDRERHDDAQDGGYAARRRHRAKGNKGNMGNMGRWIRPGLGREQPPIRSIPRRW